MLEARIGPHGVQLALRRRSWWRASTTAWESRWDRPTQPQDAARMLQDVLAQARKSLVDAGHGWPAALAVDVDDAWIRHASIQGEFFAMSRADVDAATQSFFARALGRDSAELALCTQPQPDGRSLWVACMPASLRDGVATVAREAQLALRSLRPALQQYVRPERRWPADGVLAVAHADGVLLACRRGGSWVALANELRRFDSGVAARAEALCRFHGIALDDASRWAALPPAEPLPAGWTRVSADGRATGADA